ncbi:MAG: type I 3-dehydroquinate dehydratase [Proteobacteria bacterium]|nr:type I 3-dehydroquinate dehydratase [Pseudomonadota bacterium]
MSKFLRIASILADNAASADQQIQWVLTQADVIELRLDLWRNLELETIIDLRKRLTLPVIFTLRSKNQGGYCELPENERLSWLEKLAELHPEYLDVEYDISKDWLNSLRSRFPKITIIGSFHDFTGVPENLQQTLTMVADPAFNILKIVVFAHHLDQALRFMIFTRTVQLDCPLIAFAMGESGQISRILAPIIGSLATYGCIDAEHQTAPGQLTLSELNDVYHVAQLNRHTHIYALLGDPVTQSPGHKFHNRMFLELGKNAVYVKCRVPPERLAATVTLMKQLPFFGFSVTIPHKETIVAYLDRLIGDAEQIKIVNTIKVEDQAYIGYNTDAVGAVSVLEEYGPLENKRCLILGAGGSAKALAFAILCKNAEVTLCNRTFVRAQLFIEKFGGKAIDFETLFASSDFPYDIVINTLPKDAYEAQCGNWQIPATASGIAMEIVLKPLETLFVKTTKIAGWHGITGDKLFAAQAIRQLKIWFDLQDSIIDLDGIIRVVLASNP